MLAVDVQKLIGVEDLDVIAYGYTFERNSVEIWFENKYLKRLTIFKGDSNIEQTINFNPEFFNIKRFYRDRTNPKLIELFRAFGNLLPLT